MNSPEMNSPVITVNSREYSLEAFELDMSLLDYLRERLELTGTKNGCGTGACGACTVLIDGVARRSCITKLAKVVGSHITTIEGLEGSDGSLHPVQQAFIDAGAVQCGFCTPGMVLSAISLLKKNSHPSREEIRKGINTNLCRCTGYQQIVDAVEAASFIMRDSRSSSFVPETKKTPEA
jgi:aerobic carbon-monoxide dehydrogenase small subunit